MKKLHALVWKEDKLYVARALELEVASQGKTEKKALSNLQEALELYFENEDGGDLIKIESPKIQNLQVNLHA